MTDNRDQKSEGRMMEYHDFIKSKTKTLKPSYFKQCVKNLEQATRRTNDLFS
jgi:hypothetical protein